MKRRRARAGKRSKTERRGEKSLFFLHKSDLTKEIEQGEKDPRKENPANRMSQTTSLLGWRQYTRKARLQEDSFLQSLSLSVFRVSSLRFREVNRGWLKLSRPPAESRVPTAASLSSFLLLPVIFAISSARKPAVRRDSLFSKEDRTNANDSPC